MSPADAQYALLCAYAEDMYQAAGPTVLEPPLDARAAAAGWTLVGYLSGADAVGRSLGRLEIGGQRVFYGFLAQRGSQEFVLVVRGTMGMLEWIEDALFALRPHPLGGQCEDGFWGLYQTLELARIHGGELGLVGAGVAALLPAGLSTVTVTGHSLGAALATYLTLDLSQQLPRLATGACVRGRLFASPRPGDGAFARLFSQATQDVIGYAYAPDYVPQVPIGMGYVPLFEELLIDPAIASVRIRMHGWCAHHAVCYAALLDPSSVDPTHLPAIDRENGACILPAAVAIQ